MNKKILSPIERIEGEVYLPGSKSISNRALLLAAMSRGQTQIHNLLNSEDTQYMLKALHQLGVKVEQLEQNLKNSSLTVEVHGKAGPLSTIQQELDLNLGLAGTAYRPLTAALCLGKGTFTLSGNARMNERPIADLVYGLSQLGANISYLGEDGFPPLLIKSAGLTGGSIEMSGAVSSQFLTSLLMAAPLADGPIAITVIDDLVSKPYLDITTNLMQKFGATVSQEAHRTFAVTPGQYHSPGKFLVEGDASNASYFLAAAALPGNQIRVYGIGKGSIQGDVAFVHALEAMGASVSMGFDWIEVKGAPLHGVDLDLNHIPDAAMTLVTLALFADGPTRIRNIANWRVKETDRLDAMAREMRKLGATIEEGPDYIFIQPPSSIVSAAIDTYGDHRMAMCFSLAALGNQSITINEPECVAKTFPNYFEIYESVCKH
ncbi:MAG: 3-phosphoshikimate 1-carboxyvinyltransferase [Pseudomonadales bacterium]|nr:3-phosphoshikimate 1-carboxyvinyltransferase [Pseudomonadales bacterium]